VILSTGPQAIYFLSSDSQDNVKHLLSEPRLDDNKRSDTNYYNFKRSFRLLLVATVVHPHTGLLRMCVAASTYLPSVQGYFASPTLMQQRIPWRSLSNTSVLQGHRVGNGDQGLSLDTDGGTTRH
jgi:hypothetical protein